MSSCSLLLELLEIPCCFICRSEMTGFWLYSTKLKVLAETQNDIHAVQSIILLAETLPHKTQLHAPEKDDPAQFFSSLLNTYHTNTVYNIRSNPKRWEPYVLLLSPPKLDSASLPESSWAQKRAQDSNPNMKHVSFKKKIAAVACFGSKHTCTRVLVVHARKNEPATLAGIITRHVTRLVCLATSLSMNMLSSNCTMCLQGAFFVHANLSFSAYSDRRMTLLDHDEVYQRMEKITIEFVKYHRASWTKTKQFRIPQSFQVLVASQLIFSLAPWAQPWPKEGQTATPSYSRPSKQRSKNVNWCPSFVRHLSLH